MTFNQILQKGVPPSWCIGLIHLIFKAGDKDDPGNYRGITMVVILSKLYAMVLERERESLHPASLAYEDGIVFMSEPSAARQ